MLLLIAATLLQNLAGYTLGYWSARWLGLAEKDRRTIALEVGMQNAGLASGIALTMGRLATVGLAPAVFGPMMNISGSCARHLVAPQTDIALKTNKLT